MSSIRISSPAKINLGLKILGLREDGFHEVQTHLVQVDLFDQFLIGKRKRRIDIFVDNSSIKGKHNIIYKAAIDAAIPLKAKPEIAFIFFCLNMLCLLVNFQQPHIY